MQYVANGYEISYLFPERATRPAFERRRFDPKIGIRSFLIAAGGMLLVAALSYNNNASINKAVALDFGPECTLGGCPRTITPENANQTLNYPVDAEFTVLLTPGTETLTLSCTPEGAVQETAFGDPTAKHYLAVRAGTCFLHSDRVNTKINVLNPR